MKFHVTPEDIKKSRVPHEIFLTNLIFNHVLVFVAIMSASSLTHLIVFIPVFSVASLAYIFWGAHKAKTQASWYVSGHWQVAARRSRFFLIMLAVMGGLLGIIYFASGGEMKPQHWAFSGAAFLPIMVSVLGLIVFESDAMHQAKNGILPDWVNEKYPENALEPIESVIPVETSEATPIQEKNNG